MRCGIAAKIGRVGEKERKKRRSDADRVAKTKISADKRAKIPKERERRDGAA